MWGGQSLCVLRNVIHVLLGALTPLLLALVVQGGAYGVSAGYDHFSGVYAATSYRDPNLSETLANYDGIAEYACAVVCSACVGVLVLVLVLVLVRQ